MVGDEEERQLEELEGGLVLHELLDPLDHLLELAADLGLEDLGEVVHVVELEGLGPGEVVVKVLEVKGILISREVCLLLNGQQIVKEQNVKHGRTEGGIHPTVTASTFFQREKDWTGKLQGQEFVPKSTYSL